MNEIKDNKYKMILSTENPEYSITVTKDNKYGVINSNGIEVVENRYSYLKYLDNNYFGMSANFNYQKGLENLEGILYGTN